MLPAHAAANLTGRWRDICLSLPARLLLLVGSLVGVGWAGWGVSIARQGMLGTWGAVFNIIVPVLAALALLLAQRLRGEHRTVSALCLLGAFAAPYLAEGVLEFQAAESRKQRADVDRRSKIEVIADLRRQGRDAYPVMRAKTLLERDADGRLVSVLGEDGFLPLASLPLRTVVSCNESGRWLVYDSDRHGFNNPDPLWNGAADAVLLGDSFAHGSCVPADRNIAGRLNEAGIRAVNLGVSGFGPLSMLAALREYAAALRPRHVFWLFFEGNDLAEDQPLERASPMLVSYLEKPDFSQSLMARSGEVAQRLKDHLDLRLKEAMARFDNPNEKLLDFLTLYHLRERFGLGVLTLGMADGQDVSAEAAYFKRVLELAARQTQAWGGRLVLVYLPESARFQAAGRSSEAYRRLHGEVLKAAESLDLAVIDMAASFDSDPQPGRFFVYPGSHYNESGYERVADAIKVYLETTKRAR